MLFVFSGLFNLTAASTEVHNLLPDRPDRQVVRRPPAGRSRRGRRRVRRHLLRAGRGGLLDVEFQARGRRLPGAVLHRHRHALRHDNLTQVRRRPARRAGDPAARAVPVERRQVLLDGRERAVEVRLHLPARRRCRRHVRRAENQRPASYLFGGSGGGGGSKGNIVFNGTTWFTSGSLDDLEYARDGSHCAASNDADSDVEDGDRRRRQRRAAPRARPGLARGKPPCPPAPDHQKTWDRTHTPTIRRLFTRTTTLRAGPKPGPRVSDAVCIGLKEKVYVLGGKLHYGNDSSANVIAFTPSGTQGDVVISSAAAMPTDVSPACAAVLNGRIYAVGGTDPRDDATSSSHRILLRRQRLARRAVDAAPVHRRRLRGARRRAVRVGPVVRRRRTQGRRVHVRRW